MGQEGLAGLHRTPAALVGAQGGVLGVVQGGFDADSRILKRLGPGLADGRLKLAGGDADQ